MLCLTDVIRVFEFLYLTGRDCGSGSLSENLTQAKSADWFSSGEVIGYHGL
jgi:hypothetical protein